MESDQACYLDASGRFVMEDYAARRPFSSFLPGIAGPLGTPLWVFYVNRGQAIASFGVASKDHPIMEFQPANKAYQTTPWTGFRTFVKVQRAAESILYEPFSPWQSDDAARMLIGMNELELQTISAAHGLQTTVRYFTLPGETIAALVRQVTLTNLDAAPLALEVLDGLPQVIPYGVDNWQLKEINRTIEAWMQVVNLENGVPFYCLKASAADTVEVGAIQAGYFTLAFVSEGTASRLLPALVDPALVFGQNTALSAPDRFQREPLAALLAQRQITTGKTPCGFFGLNHTLEPGASLTLHAIIGHAHTLAQLSRQQGRFTQVTYLAEKRAEAHALTQRLTDTVATQTGLPSFDAYCRQTFLDNVLRGGWPLFLGDAGKSFVYHIYSRKHGDLERDYNAFYLAPELYSQGNGNYRDVNQNRRCDVLLNPRVGDFNVLSFLGLLQADGYNPLVVNGVCFTVASEHRAEILALVEQPDVLAPLLAQPFTPGSLLKVLDEREIGLRVPAESFITAALTHAEQHFVASFGEGYWTDHWFYNLDLLETYLAVYPDKKADLLFGQPVVPFFDSPAVVQPRARKYRLVDGKVRQYGAAVEDAEKVALIAARTASPNLMCTAHGHGAIYRTTVAGKLLALALVKFATLDPWGMGVEMEAGRPSWCDALNGLPGLFGSSLPETFELARLLAFLIEALTETAAVTLRLPVEFHGLLQHTLDALSAWEKSTDADRDFSYWDAVATAREAFRAETRLGFAGDEHAFTAADLLPALRAMLAKVEAGLQRAVALNDGLPPTYFAYTVTDYTLLAEEGGQTCVTAKHFEPTVLPLYLEGPVHALKLAPDVASARRLYTRIRESALFDRDLAMYRLNASLTALPHEIGRARAFTPGWLENESVWLHMEYKYLLEVLKAGLDEEFLEDFKRALIPFQDPQRYGRSPLENSSFLVSSAHPDVSLHGAGFVARFTGATAEFLNIWSVMMAGRRPFFLRDGELCLTFRPVLPGWLFRADGTLTFTFLGQCAVTYHIPERVDTCTPGLHVRKLILQLRDGQTVEIAGEVIGAPYAALVREGQIPAIEVMLGMQE